jgi:hypothetical protein
MKSALVKAILAVGTLASLAGAQEEEQGRGVARLSVINGDVSVRRGDSGDWIAAAINAPLMTGDRLFCGPQSRAELQFDFANMIRVGENSEVRLSELEYQRYQVQVARGTVMFRVLRDSRSDVELSTPSVSVRPMKRGSYRVTVREDGASEITVRSGEVEVYTPRGAERLTAGRAMLARGTASDPEFQIVAAARADDWDRWNERRDQDLERTRSYQYVSTDIYGAEDLDGHGEWVDAPGYGWVWSPRVADGWAPYRYGRWSWIDWYGWNWVSYDPWGWAPYHYGRWFNHGSRWCWWPGAMHSRHYWSPAQVAFFGWGGHGGAGIGIGFGNVGWVPLAPHETYHPWYGQRYYSGYRNRTYVDNSVHVVNNINITNIYRNSRVINGVTAVNAGDFTRGRAGNRVKVSDNELRGAGLVRGQVPLAPERESLRLADREVRSGAVPGASGNGRFFSRRQPAAVDRVAFDDQRRGMEQVVRRTFGEPGTTGNAAGGRVANIEGRREAQPAQGWRRADEPGRAGTGARGVEAAPSRREATGSDGWQRFPNTGRAPERVVERQSPTVPRSDPGRSGRESNDSWRRFETTPRTETPSRTRGDIGAGSRRESTGDPGWRGSSPPARVETPSRRESANDPGWRGSGPPARVETPSRRESTGDPGWRGSGPPARVETPSRRESSPRTESPRYEQRNTEPMRINPPIVRERANPRFEERGGFSRMPESRPQMSAPAPQRSAPQMSAPSPQRSAPQMSAPAPQRSAPQMSAPSPQRSAPQMSAPSPRGGSEGPRGGGRSEGGSGARSEGGSRSEARSSGRGR